MRAISPIIAVIIIVSVAVALSIAIAMWMMGIVSSNTNVEKLELVSTYARIVVDKFRGKTLYRVTLLIRNTGPTEATIRDIFVNGKPIYYYGGWVNLTNTTLPVSLKPGENLTLYIDLGYENFTHGQMIEVRVRTASGRDYYRAVQLP